MIYARHFKGTGNFLLLIFMLTLFSFPKLEATPESAGSSISSKNVNIEIGSVGAATVIPERAVQMGQPSI